MKYSIALLTDSPTTKTVCITPASDAASTEPTPSSRMPTQIMRLFLADTASSGDTMITVVVKGVELPVQQVEKLVSEFFAERAQQNEPDALTISNERTGR